MMAGALSGYGGLAVAGQDLALRSLATSDRGRAQGPLPDPAAQAGATSGEEVPFSELNEALSAARSRLAELTKAAEIAKVAGAMRKQLEAAETENRQLKALLNQVQEDNGQLHAQRRDAARRIELLEGADSRTKEQARRLGEELAAVRWQNGQLSTSLARAEAAARDSQDSVQSARTELNSKVTALTAAAEESAGEIARLQQALDKARDATLDAEETSAERDAAFVQLRKLADQATTDAAKLAKELDTATADLQVAQSVLTATRGELDDAAIALKAAKQETGVLRAQVVASRTEADRLRGDLASATDELGQVRTINAELQEQVGSLQAAASKATEAARLNLIAVEDRINEINAALASVKSDELLATADEPGAAAGLPAAGASEAPDRAAAVGNEARAVVWVPRPSPARKAARQQLIAAAASDIVGAPSVSISNPLANRVGERTIGRTEDDSPEVEVAALIQDLPPNHREQAKVLLAGLDVQRETRGLSMTVPGAVLFAVDSEQIEPAARDALADVAELLNLYQDREVLIVGHTDAVGDAAYNQKLSERRAALVKAFFVENFAIDEGRLAIEGQGEQNPITSNATLDGRNANRRVEVVILN